MNEYARSMPHLGADPTPGDVDGTKALAKRHHQAASDLRKIIKSLKKIDLRKWQGQAGDATRMRVIEHIVPALERSADSAERLEKAATHWARRLQEFQDEADELERKTAHHAKRHHDRSTRGAATAQAGSTSKSETRSADPSTSDPAADLRSRYLAESRKTADEVEEHSGLKEEIEPYRKVLEGLLSPFDITVTDHWIELLEKLSEIPLKRLEALDKAIGRVRSLKESGQGLSEELISLARLAESTGNELDAREAFNPEWLKAATHFPGGIRYLGNTLSGLGVLADAANVAYPLDKGAMGWVDRSAAGANGVLVTLNLAVDEMPGVGEVLMAGTGIYLAGDYLYHSWTPFRSVSNDVGHATATVAKGTEHAVKSGWHSVKSKVGGWF